MSIEFVQASVGKSGYCVPRTAVVTVYQSNIPTDVLWHQAEVINRFLPDGCEFAPRLVRRHAIGLDEYFLTRRHEAYLVLDVDCIPLAKWVIPWILQNALAGVLIGGAQRANHLENGEHIYVGPGVMAFSRDTFEKCGGLSFEGTSRGDVGEEFTYAAEGLEIPISFLWPTHVVANKWALRGTQSFGIGTTYAGAFFHAFQISSGLTIPIFLEKCQKLLKHDPELSVSIDASNA